MKGVARAQKIWLETDSQENTKAIIARGENGLSQTYEEAAKHGREVLELLIDSSLELGESLPEPAKYDDSVSA